jgi:putative glutathione S-transferase
MPTQQARTALDEMAGDGSFKRTDAAWRSWVSSEEGAKFPPAKGRYHLFAAYACPWAHRTLITRALKGLEDTISLTVVQPVWKKTKDSEDDAHTGWVFADPDGEPYPNTIGLGGPFPASYAQNKPDHIFNSVSIREFYERAGDKDGKYSVPILWDTVHNTIVSNESADIVRMFNSEFNEFAKNPDLDLYPESMREKIEEVNSWVYPTINNGVYRCGFAKSQGAYDGAIDELTDSFDRVAKILERQRFIAGDRFTEADVRLVVTLLRFDEVYTVYFKTNTRSVVTTPTILNYCREVYQMLGVKETTNMEQIKMHYYASHPDLNRFSIIPKGDDFEGKLKEKHNRS